MVLDGQGEGVIAQTDLLNNIIVGTPSFDLETICEPVDCLVMRTVYVVELMGCFAVETQPLNVLFFFLRQPVARNIQPERAA
jgi:hypothetical protein